MKEAATVPLSSSMRLAVYPVSIEGTGARDVVAKEG